MLNSWRCSAAAPGPLEQDATIRATAISAIVLALPKMPIMIRSPFAVQHLCIRDRCLSKIITDDNLCNTAPEQARPLGPRGRVRAHLGPLRPRSPQNREE